MSIRKHLFYLLLYLFFLPIIGVAQTPLSKEQQQKFMNAFRDGDQYLVEKNLKKAQKSFEEAIAIKPTMAAAYRRLGVIHELKNEYEVSAQYFEECIKINPKLSRALYFQSGEMLMKAGYYVKALGRLKEYQSFQVLPPESFENGQLELTTENYYNTLIDSYLSNCKFAAHKTDFTGVKISNLGAAINSVLDESFPYLSNNESWMFYTRNVPNGEEDKLMLSTAEGGAWTKSKPLLNNKINKDFNQGMGKVSRDEKMMYFPGCMREDILGGCDVLMARMNKSEILDINTISQGVNSEFWDSQPSINCEGKSLYFVSDRPGGFGGTDIWVSQLQEDGTWTDAINLGDKINTPMDEESPFIGDDNVTLFFASNGHPGYGDMDIFYARNSEEGYWSEPENLGKPVNSTASEIGFFMNARGNKGYIASDRAGGFGGLDIYEFNMPAKKDFEEIAYIKGTVRDAVTNEPVESVIYIADKGNYATDEQGRFFACHPTLSDLKILVSERKYRDYTNTFELTNWNSDGFVEINLYLQPLNQEINLERIGTTGLPTSSNLESEKIEVQPVKIIDSEASTDEIYTTSDVFFYFDDFKLTKEAMYSIDRLIDDLDKEKLALIVVEGFADQIGSDEYNLRLSEKRAQEVADFFKSRGVTNLKIKYKGYGESRTSLVYSQNRKVVIYVYYRG